MLTSPTDNTVKRGLKSEKQCKPFNTDGADHQSVSSFLPCTSADFRALMNLQKTLCKGAKLCSRLGS